MIKIKGILFLVLFILLVYTRFVNLSWGLPYSMHPDERNMANAIQSLNCEVQSSKFKVQSCFNPHFFAYGQFSLYLGYGIVFLFKFFDGDLGTPISFEEAALSLRFIAAVSSILNVFILLKIVNLLISNYQYPSSKKTSINNYQSAIAFLVFIFSPFFIQFSHFGTTESLLMFLYSIIMYLSLKYLKGDLGKSFYLLTSIFSGLAIATKVSSVLFLVIPIVVLLYKANNTILARSISIWYLLTLTLVFSILFSPHNFISFPQFLGSMKYESDVALGSYRAFYTRQFVETIPVLFQSAKIFPYTLGWPAFILFLFGFIFLPYKKEFNLLRLAFISVFIPNAFLYAKWTRFMTPIFPLMLVTAIAFLFYFKIGIKNILWINLKVKSEKLKVTNKNLKILNFSLSFLFFIFYILILIPGLFYLSIYQNPDVRFTASDWIYKNIPENSYILFETANVVDIPIQSQNSLKQNKFASGQAKVKSQNYQMISFNFYDLDENPTLQPELWQHVAKADYIFIPSRRIFANHWCEVKSEIRLVPRSPKDEVGNPKSPLRSSSFEGQAGTNSKLEFLNLKQRCEDLRIKYPLLNDFYDKLFSGELGFVKVAEFNSFPKIQLFGKTILEFPDEEAEETWTVFDHPVIRIYKKLAVSRK